MPQVTYSARNRTDAYAALRRIKPERESLPDWVHPEVLYHYDDWVKLRDVVDGERAIKAAREAYLPKFAGMDAQEYQSYLDRASFYPFTGRTIKALTGRLLRRQPTQTALPDKRRADMRVITHDGKPFPVFYKRVTREVIQMGRIGVLLDMPTRPSSQPKPYFTSYMPENILDWDVEEMPTSLEPDAPTRMVLSRVVLREFVERATAAVPQGHAGDSNKESEPFRVRYRVLSLQNGVYQATLYEGDESTDAELDETYAKETTIPKVRGKSLNYIPFYIFGAADGGTDVEQSPVLGIAQINLSHFRSYAHLEHGRYYTGFPIYYAEITGSEGGKPYEIGPNRVWEVEKGAKVGVVEFNGQGLKFLENALTQKEAQAAALGGRMIGVTSQSVSESADQVKMKEMNEQAMLLDIALQLDYGFTQLMRWWLDWSGDTALAKTYEIEFNKDFLLDGAGAREFRAIHAMYKDGILPIEVVYDYFRKFEVIPDHLEIDKFRKLLETAESFPQQPDADARLEGFSDAKTKLNEEVRQENMALAEKHRKEDTALAEKRPADPAAVPPKPGSTPPRKPAANTGIPSKK